MIERILLILKTKNISSSQLADEIGVQRSNISHILSGRNKPSLEFIKKILDRYKDINMEWLINGKGPMQKEIITANPDLFTILESNDAKKISSKPETPAEIEEIKPVENANSNFDEPDIQKVIESIPVQHDHENNTKKIERIVILYKDKSFSTYHPE